MVAEAFRTVLTSIIKRKRQPPARPGGHQRWPGRRQSHLAIAMAEIGRRVLLVDADLRKPRVHHVFGLDNERGWTF